MDIKLILQILGVVLGLLYLWLEYRANIWLWVVGAAMPVVHGVLYFHQGLYADFAMQAYYVAAGVYGLAVWLRDGSRAKETPDASKVDKHNGKTLRTIAPTPSRLILPLVGAFVALQVVIYMLLVRFTDSTVPFWDAVTTALAVVAMWMLSRKYVEQWLVWLVVDAITVGLYLYKEIPLTASLYTLYTVLALVGYLRWRRLTREGVA